MNIKEQIEQLIVQIKQQPTNYDLRVALIQYYCIDGQWDKAQKTVDQYLKLSNKKEQVKFLLQFNIIAEIERLNTLKGILELKFFPDSEIKIGELNKKIFKSVIQDTNQIAVKEQFLNSFEYYTESFNISLNNGHSFSGIWIDSDVRFSFILEIFVQEQYYWLAISEIASIKFKANQYLTDILWRRAEIILKDGRHIACFIPARYPFFESDNISDKLKYCKETQWLDYGELSVAQGQKTWTNGTVDVGILDIFSFENKS
ncbi:type VI secretion system accessory protein TagJ [Acinetobacter populi]|uniref:ImpE protein n=1 Tax=Acinetobacter populi TaxID=1582270 RepID=A0A1Z9Z1B5_9GAMM|nr:type VI secretion system accessory protein TagJ [Acinetobacter populi]OUY08254.1 hypothetical protein CAP51_01130 [Acinetobacter populi]